MSNIDLLQIFTLTALFLFSPVLTISSYPSSSEIIKNLEKLQPYQKAEGIEGVIVSEGSDTMDPLIHTWCRMFASYYDGKVNCKISDGKGSGVGPPLHLEGQINIARLSRPYKRKEVDDFVNKFGYHPTMFRTALDTLGVFVNNDNPIECINLDELDAVFSQDMKCGPKSSIDTWDKLGLKGDYAGKKISLYGRIPVSGTHQFFKKNILCDGPFKSSITEYGDSPNITRDIENNIYGIGYAGISCLTKGTKALSVSAGEKNDKECIPATAEYVANASYPISRILYIYVNNPPNTEYDPLVREFIKFVFSKEGQEIVYVADFYPLSRESIQDETVKLSK